MSKPPVVWTIAGFDPTSGAGITADIKTIASFECYGAACITALTVQNTVGVRRTEPVSSSTVRDTLYALLEDLPPQAIKLGMLATADIVRVVAHVVSSLHCPVVLDPVLCSSSGAHLLDEPGIALLRDQLLPLITVITPNRAEAAILTSLPSDDPESAARALRRLGAKAAVVTGGDISPFDSRNALSEDVLAHEMRSVEFVETLSTERVHSTSTHGTGCAFSTAVACSLALGQNIPAAVTLAKAFVRRAIERAPGLGTGKGPMGLEHAATE